MRTRLFTPTSRIESKLCFVLMPFSLAFNNVYDTITSSLGGYCGLTCVRADEISHAGRITEDIWDKINKARFLLADLTGRNANVFYELGLAHALGKHVVLITSDNDVPFDLKDLRYIRYQPDNLGHLRTELIKYAKGYISTVPDNWERNFCPSRWKGGYVKITDLQFPSVITEGQSFDIHVTARNNGANVRQGYFSVSFPGGIEGITVESNAQTQIGCKGDFWAGRRHILEYSIAEAFKCHHDSNHPDAAWPAGWTYRIKVSGYAKRSGLCWFYLNASCESDDGRWIWDPFNTLLDVDQRDENAYCGVIEVVSNRE